jgi:hypothetical protein
MGHVQSVDQLASVHGKVLDKTKIATKLICARAKI